MATHPTTRYVARPLEVLYTRIPMAIQDPQAPATKQDIGMLMQKMGKLYDANEQWKNEVIDEMDKRILTSEERTKHHFDVIAENIHREVAGANKDEIEIIKDRVTKLEEHTGLVAA